MVWYHVTEFESADSTLDDNPFAGHRSEANGKISVKLPPNAWLCWKLEKLNLTLTIDYLSHSTDANGLCKDQVVNDPHSQRWCDVYSEKKK